MTDHLKELEAFCQAQLARLESQSPPVIHPTTQAVSVDHVGAHAVGPRKPSLSELEMEGTDWHPKSRLLLKRRSSSL